MNKKVKAKAKVATKAKVKTTSTPKAKAKAKAKAKSTKPVDIYALVSRTVKRYSSKRTGAVTRTVSEMCKVTGVASRSFYRALGKMVSEGTLTKGAGYNNYIVNRN